MISVDMGCVGADLGCTERMVSICAKDSGGPYNYNLVTALVNTARCMIWTLRLMFIRIMVLMWRQLSAQDMTSDMADRTWGLCFT